MESYSISEEQFDNSITPSYGIFVTVGGNVVKTISDITPDFPIIKYLVDTINQENLSLIHLDEVVDNFMYNYHSF